MHFNVELANYVVHTEKQNHAFVLKTFHALADQVARLKRQGAHHIVVFNLHHLEATPLARQLNEQFGQHYLVKLSKMIADFNDHLDNFYAADDKVWVYDVYTFDRKLQIKPHEYVRSGKPRLMFEMVRPCYVNQGNYIERMGASCPNPWVYFYYDRIHPTTYTHALMAEDLYRQWRLTLKR